MSKRDRISFSGSRCPKLEQFEQKLNNVVLDYKIIIPSIKEISVSLYLETYGSLCKYVTK